MKKNKRVLKQPQMLRLFYAACIVLAFIACKNPAEGYSGNSSKNGGSSGGSGGNSSSGNSVSLPAIIGKLTITGLGAYNGKYIWLGGMIGTKVPWGLTGIIGDYYAYKLVGISNDRAEVPLYTQSPSPTLYDRYAPLSAYNGTDSATDLVIYIITDNNGELTQAEVNRLSDNTVSTKFIDRPNPDTDIRFSSGGNLTVTW